MRLIHGILLVPRVVIWSKCLCREYVIGGKSSKMRTVEIKVGKQGDLYGTISDTT